MPTPDNKKIISLAALSEFKNLLIQDFNGRYVPYFGADASVNLGANDFITESLFEARNVSNDVINAYTRYRAGSVVVSDASAQNSKIINFPAASYLENSNTFATQEWANSNLVKINDNINIVHTGSTAHGSVTVNSPTGIQSEAYARIRTYAEGQYAYGELIVSGYSGTTRYRRDYIQIDNYKLSFPSLSADKTFATTDQLLQLVSSGGDNGSASTAARSDHTHALATPITYDDNNNEVLGQSGFMNTYEKTWLTAAFENNILAAGTTFYGMGSISYLKLTGPGQGTTPQQRSLSFPNSSGVIATQEWVSSQGYTSNQGTVTSVAIGVGTGLAIDDASAITTSGTRTISIASGYKLPTTTEWNAKVNSGDLGSAAAKSYTTSVTSGSNDLVTSGAVFTAISNLPTPMQFKGTLGVGGTISVLPDASASNNGYTYKVISDITSLNAKVGDVFVSNGTSWILIPAGDDVEDTWREIYVDGALFKGSGISSGRVNFVPGPNVTIRADGNDIIISSSSDADTLDGHDSSYFYPASNPNSYTSVTESTVSGWGFTKNIGTVTSITLGLVAYTPDSGGVVALPAYPTSLPANGGDADTVDGYHASAFLQPAQDYNLLNHGNEFTFAPSGYTGDIYFNFRTAGGTNGNITNYILGNGAGGSLGTIIHSGNIGSQSVSYASSAGNADTLDNHDSSYFYPASNPNGYTTLTLVSSGGNNGSATTAARSDHTHAVAVAETLDSNDVPISGTGSSGFMSAHDKTTIDRLENGFWHGGEWDWPNFSIIDLNQGSIFRRKTVNQPTYAVYETNFMFPQANSNAIETLATQEWVQNRGYTTDSVSGVNDGTNWTSITINGVTKAIPSGGSGSLTLDDVSDGTTRKLNKVSAGASTGLGEAQLTTAVITGSSNEGLLKLTRTPGAQSLRMVTSYYPNRIVISQRAGDATLMLPYTADSIKTLATTDQIPTVKHLYKYWIVFNPGYGSDYFMFKYYSTTPNSYPTVAQLAEMLQGQVVYSISAGSDLALGVGQSVQANTYAATLFYKQGDAVYHYEFTLNSAYIDVDDEGYSEV